MYCSHDCFPTPEDDTPIWRYMDITKSLSLLKESVLYFSRLDTFDDPFEGSYPKAYFGADDQTWKQLRERMVTDPDEVEEMKQQFSDFESPEEYSEKIRAINESMKDPVKVLR